MSELEQKISEINQKVSGIDQRLERHEGKIEKLLGDISESLHKMTEIMVKQEVQEEASKIDREKITKLENKYHELDIKAELAIQSEESIKKTADEIKTTLKGALKWGFGLFGSLMILLVAAAIRAALT
jgi:seryl-tRNA synthetase